MSERDFDRLSDEEFERFLQQEASGINVSERIAKSVNPWKKSTNMIFAGLVLQLFTVAIYYLNYILPILGMILVFFGFRILSGENKWFMAGKIMAFVKCIGWIVSRVSESIMWLDSSAQERFYMSMRWFNVVLMLMIIICLWGGFKQVQKKSNSPAHTLSFAMFFFAYLLLAMAAFVVKDAVLLPVIFALAFIVILFSIRRIFKRISVAGYAIDSKVVKIPNFVFVVFFAVLTVGGIFISHTFFTSYPMDFKPVENTVNAQVDSAEKQLLEKGLPEEILELLTDDDIIQCKNPVRIVVKDVDTYKANDWDKYLTLRTVMVQLEGESETWKIIHAFRWEKTLTKHHSDCIHFDPVYCDEENYWMKSGKITGQVLYDEDGKVFVSPYNIREDVIGKSKNTDDIFYSLWGNGEGTRQAVGEFTFPKNAESSRGYIAYDVTSDSRGEYASSYFTYTHDDEFIYPYKKASDYRWESTTISSRNTAMDQFFFVGVKDLYMYDDEEYTIYQ